MSCVVSFCPNSDAEESHPVSAASCCLLLQCVCVCVCMCVHAHTHLQACAVETSRRQKKSCLKLPTALRAHLALRHDYVTSSIPPDCATQTVVKVTGR